MLEYGPHRREFSGSVPATTNNRMELQAAIEALRALKERCEVQFHTDSEYVRHGISRWISQWKKNGWKTREKQAVKNEDLWRELDQLAGRHKITWHWVRGHSGQPLNERCDQLAVEAIRKLRSRSKPGELAQALAVFRKQQETRPAIMLKGVTGLLWNG